MINIKKQNLIIIIFAVVLVLIISAIAVLSFRQKTLPQKPTPIASPSPVAPLEDASVEYDVEKTTELISKLKTRQVLTQEDNIAKEKILALLPTGQRSGIVYRSENIIIDYTSSANVFQVEILTTSIDSAKNEGTSWFLSQGMSKQGICNYPVQFYLNYDVAQVLKDDNIIFNPLAKGC